MKKRIRIMLTLLFVVFMANSHAFSANWKTKKNTVQQVDQIIKKLTENKYVDELVLMNSVVDLRKFMLKDKESELIKSVNTFAKKYDKNFLKLLLASYKLNYSKIVEAENILNEINKSANNELNYMVATLRGDLASSRLSHDNAVEYYKEALRYLSLAKTKGERIDQKKILDIVSLNNLSGALLESKRYEEALKYIKEAMKISKTTANPYTEKDSKARAMINYARYYADQGDYYSASIITEAAIKIYKVSNDIYFPSMILLLFLHATYASSYDAATTSCEMAIDIAKKINLDDAIYTMACYQVLGDSFLKKKNYDKASSYYKLSLEGYNKIYQLFDENRLILELKETVKDKLLRLKSKSSEHPNGE